MRKPPSARAEGVRGPTCTWTDPAAWKMPFAIGIEAT